ncbi:MAG: YceI family protein [Gemmatimonadaceae bacterium]|nr:YceI family protein [Gemmatimonadaceae bacterium]NUO94948.1 YceI family protein [Gemmatimonadaceae bacterium]NUP54620.1 YceI family protein [Gemmatimonadaceae bacterium]NUP70210.1 YceI family protein [Gemmatimonadaceae bacterium]NUR32500.1 YceI family protein [Gemmatimonadaceae bacterium]
MTSTMWTAVVALSAAAFVANPRPGSAVAISPAVHPGGAPDTLVVNPRASSVHWAASGLGGSVTRQGTIGMGTGMFVIRHQQLTSGLFTVNMRQLDDELQGPELFDVAHNPTAWFSSTGMKRVASDRWELTGNLTIRGVTRPVIFLADVRWEELGHMIATSTFTIDRREWGIGTRGAGFVSDFSPWAIQLTITVDARRKQPAVATP